MATQALSARVLSPESAALPESGASASVRAPLRRSRGFVEEEGGLFVSTRAGLEGATAALLAVALEGLTVLTLIGAWQIWRLHR
jgi:hypothetical protein